MSDLRLTGTNLVNAADGPVDRYQVDVQGGPVRSYYDPNGPNAGLTHPGATILQWTDTVIDINDPSLNGKTVTDVFVRDVDNEFTVAFILSPPLDVPLLTVTYDDALDRLVVQSDFPIFANPGAPNQIWADIDGTNTNAAVGLTYVSDTEAYYPNALASLGAPTTILQVKVGRSPLYANNDIVGHWVGSVLVEAPADMTYAFFTPSSGDINISGSGLDGVGAFRVFYNGGASSVDIFDGDPGVTIFPTSVSLNGQAVLVGEDVTQIEAYDTLPGSLLDTIADQQDILVLPDISAVTSSSADTVEVAAANAQDVGRIVMNMTPPQQINYYDPLGPNAGLNPGTANILQWDANGFVIEDTQLGGLVLDALALIDSGTNYGPPGSHFAQPFNSVPDLTIL